MKVLNDHEASSAVWMKIREHLEERLALLRAKNDDSKPVDETEKLRGRIREVKYLLSLDRQDLETESDDLDY